jgi:sugar phosphate isomerase/epimerase
VPISAVHQFSSIPNHLIAGLSLYWCCGSIEIKSIIAQIMHISFATANLFFIPFPQVVEIIAQAGFQSIELDLHWQGGEWEMAQHLKGVAPRQAVQWIHQAGLKVTSIHDGGGMLENNYSIKGFLNPSLDHYLDQLGYAPELIAFHTPHIPNEKLLSPDPKGMTLQPCGVELEMNESEAWQRWILGEILQPLETYRSQAAFITIENIPPLPGYTLPLTQPLALKSFTANHGLGITLDTTHYAQMGQDLLEAAQILNGNIRSIHLSDFKAGRTHVFIGDGDLSLAEFFRSLETGTLNSIVLECSLSSNDRSDREMQGDEIVARLRLARNRLETYLSQSKT